MAMRVQEPRAKPKVDPQRVFDEIRAKIAQRLQEPTLRLRSHSQLEMAIGTFAPSWLLDGERISDYAFIGARYVSLVTGEVFIVVQSDPDRKAIIAREVGFWRSFLHDGNRVVSISVDGWLDNVMHLYSTNGISFAMHEGEIVHMNGEVVTRRSYVDQKLRAYGRYLHDHWAGRLKAIRATVEKRLPRRKVNPAA
ncbi:hypothetical protein [Cupriavidus sp. TMH.W2]|uniref:hypothetical protein n=1 Tax=Cupriavidus sp. TMH.W2 TaxID=3434465 RepID=UPI003D770085